MGHRVKNNGGPHRLVTGRRIGQGQVFTPTDEEWDGMTRQDGTLPSKFEEVGRPTPTRSRPKPKPSPSGPDVSQYHTGNGWYDLPGRDKKVQGEAKARAALLEDQADSSEGNGEGVDQGNGGEDDAGEE